MSDIEKSWEEVAEQVRAKLKEAASALAEANRLTDKHGIISFIMNEWVYDELGSEKAKEMREKLELIRPEVRNLESVIDAAGWSTSSSHC